MIWWPAVCGGEMTLEFINRQLNVTRFFDLLRNLDLEAEGVQVRVHISTRWFWHSCDSKSIFKRGLTWLNSEFSFSLTGWRIKVEKPCLLALLFIHSWRKKLLDLYLFEGYLCYVKSKQPRPELEFGLLCPFPATLTLTPRAALC